MQTTNPIYEDLIEDFDPSLTDIGSLNTVHDRYQFESNFDFDLEVEEGDTHKGYEVDIYFFLPKSMGIHADSYTREDFYTDLTNYLRVKTPNYPKRLQLKSKHWGLSFLDRYFKVHLVTQKRQKLSPYVVQETKLFGCFFNTQLKNLHYGLYLVLSKKPQEFITNPQRIQALKKKIEALKSVLDLYRQRYLESMRQKKVFCDAEVRQALLLIDEYISYRLESNLISLHRLLAPHRAELNELVVFLDSILQEEIQHRKKLGWIILGESDAKEQEGYYYRLGLLKKYVSEVLFLEVQNVKKEKRYRNIIAGFGAALAALWAGLSDIRTWQAVYGPTMRFRLVAVLLVGIVAYVFKDRIKEWSKDYFNEQLKHHLPDFDMHMFYTHVDVYGDSHRYFLGTSHEFMRYLYKKAVSPDVLYVREMGHESALEPQRNEIVLHYSKKLHFNPESLHQLDQVKHLKKVVRFDLSKFLAKLDEPSKSLSYYCPEKGISLMKAPKVYHLNVVFRYAVHHSRGASKKRHHVEFERMRIILNKKGIIRIEEVVPRGEMSYEED